MFLADLVGLQEAKSISEDPNKQVTPRHTAEAKDPDDVNFQSNTCIRCADGAGEATKLTFANADEDCKWR